MKEKFSYEMLDGRICTLEDIPKEVNKFDGKQKWICDKFEIEVFSDKEKTKKESSLTMNVGDSAELAASLLEGIFQVTKMGAIDFENPDLVGSVCKAFLIIKKISESLDIEIRHLEEEFGNEETIQ